MVGKAYGNAKFLCLHIFRQEDSMEHVQEKYTFFGSGVKKSQTYPLVAWITQNF